MKFRQTDKVKNEWFNKTKEV